jgi:hypothetical protein
VTACSASAAPPPGPGPHKVWIGPADPTHKVLDGKTVSFVVPAH